MSLQPAATVAASGCLPERQTAALTATVTPRAAQPARLRNRAEFLVVRRGEKRRGRLFLLEVLNRTDDSEARVGFTVTKKVGNAVVRNRVRRRLKEALRVHAAGDLVRGSDYVIVGREDVLTASFGQIAEELSRRVRARR